MDVKKMIALSRQKAQQRTPQERLAFLQRAKILDANGHYCEQFFSQETVAKSKEKRH